VAADGNVYGMKMLTLDLSMNVVVGPQIRKDWLDKLGLEVPETNQEFYEVLKAFRDQDPNGNGKADEIPMSGVGFRDHTYSIDKMTIWPFGTTPDMYLVGDTVTYGPMTPEFREGMEWTVKLYQEGLIDHDYLLNDRGKMDGKMAANQVGVVYSWQPVKYMDSIPKKIPDFYITGIPYLRKDKNSPNYCFESRFQNTVTSTEAVITTAAEFPEQTLEWLDYPYSQEGHMLFNFGIQGDTYEMIDGNPRYTEKILDNPKHSVIVAHQLFHMAQNAWPIVQDPRHAQQLYTNPAVEACKVEWAKGDLSRLLPAGMKFDYETKDLMNQFDIDIKTYADEFMNKLIIGQADFDEWDDFISTVKDLGIDKVLNMYQEAYDTYQERMDSFTGS
jgi:putative aldouronate transport system substrate-binding protein